MRKKALIIGCKGQDGSLLSEFLSHKDYHVIGVDREIVQSNQGKVFSKVDILKMEDVNALVSSIQPDEIYYLAAYHHSSQDRQVQTRELLEKSYQVNVHGLVNFLEAIRQSSAHTRLFYASSSRVFGNPEQSPQTENTPLSPNCIYGISKVSGMQLCRFYTERYSIFTSVGILYNHESHLRMENFLSQKIVTAAKRIKAGLQKELVVGDFHAQADWGYAPDYVEAMWKMLQFKESETFIVATGKSHTVLDWINLTFKEVGLNWNEYVREDRSLTTRKQGVLVGDSSKLRRCTGWEPRTSFEEMVSLMLQASQEINHVS